jgi:hypothetical protein
VNAIEIRKIHELAISVVAVASRIHPIGCTAMKMLFCMFCRERRVSVCIYPYIL